MDEELLRRVAERDPEAVRALYRRYSRIVYGLAARITGSTSDAEEVTQDVFLKVWEKAATYRADRGKVLTWLVQIARNRSVDMLRGQTARGRRDLRLVHQLGTEGATSAPVAPTEEELPVSRERIREALATLSHPQRSALEMAFFQGFTHREISEKLGEPLGTIKTRIRDAMIRLRGLLSEEIRTDNPGGLGVRIQGRG
ncbi:MAG TPA: sigma-70 family RNA polymerase sigma factor [Spirochaetia bacterium]|nr:sigma-70 family RNA polymerase sigma factor [Spirochaetia bacterium]